MKFGRLRRRDGVYSLSNTEIITQRVMLQVNCISKT
jgi:hypothetical protein